MGRLPAFGRKTFLCDFSSGGCYRLHMQPDGELLRRFSENHSEEAFTELVQRHLNLVYSAALRQVNGDACLAQDVAQSVFIDLARKAASLSHRSILSAWLYTSTHFAAAKAVRSESRRRIREQEAHAMHELLHDPVARQEWLHLSTALDAAMQELKESDREAILLRFFENRQLAEIGARLSLTENAARMRVERALEKLRVKLARRGVATTAASLSVALLANAVEMAPAGMAATLASASLAAAASTGITLNLLNFMAITKVQAAIAGVILLGAGSGLVLQQRNIASLRNETRLLRIRVTQLQSDDVKLSLRAAQHVAEANLALGPPPAQVSPRVAAQLVDSESMSLLARLQHGETAPRLTSAEAEKYLEENHRNAASLLAAFRATGDERLLHEAMEKYPNDPQVAFSAAYAPNVSPGERRQWLKAFKQASPANPLPDYLSALDYFKAGLPDLAAQDLLNAYEKDNFQDYSSDFILTGEEAYRSAGYPEEQARIIPSMSILLPQFGELKQLNEQIVSLAEAYRQAGDESSANAALQMDATLGQRLQGTAQTSLLSKLVGVAIETIALNHMDPSAPYSNGDQTVKERLAELIQRRTDLTQFGNQLDSIYTSISAADWISYHDRWRSYGEENAMKWLLDKYK